MYLLSNETNLALAQGRHQEALELATRLSEAAAVIGDRDQMREAVLNLGIAHLRRGELDQAAAQLARAAEWALLTEDQRTSILVKVFQSECHRQRGELAEAKRLARTALEEAQKEQADQLVLEAELPGVEPGQVEVSIEGDVLTLQGKPDQSDKRPQFGRQLKLPFAVEVDSVKAAFANGILTLTLPKAAAAQRRLIAVDAA